MLTMLKYRMKINTFSVLLAPVFRYEGLLSDITVLLCHPHLPCSRARVDKQVVSVPRDVRQYSGYAYAVTAIYPKQEIL